METARARAEEIIEDGIQTAASCLVGLRRISGIELSKQIGRGLVNIVTDFVKQIQIRDARTEQQRLDHIWIGMSERRRMCAKMRRKSIA